MRSACKNTFTPNVSFTVCEEELINNHKNIHGPENFSIFFHEYPN